MSTQTSPCRRSTFFAAPVLAMGVALSACGGGGGDADRSASKAPVAQPQFTLAQGEPASISATNYRAVAADLAASYQDISAYSDPWDLRTNAAALVPSGMKAGALDTSRNCISTGTQTLRGNRRAAPPQDSPGDWYEETYANCKHSATDPELTGHLSYEMAESSTGDFWQGDVFSTGQILRSADLRFSAQGADPVVLNSEMRVNARRTAADAGSDEVLSGRIEVTSAGAPPAQAISTLINGITAQWTLVANVWTITMHATVTPHDLAGRSFQLSTESALKQAASDPAPQSGTLLASGLGGSKLKLVFLGGGNVRLEFYSAGSSTATVTENLLWTDLVP